MGHFLVPKGTEVKVVKDGCQWLHQNFKDHTTTQENTFPAEQVSVDPLGEMRTWLRRDYLKEGACFALRAMPAVEYCVP